jgi:hypothetical protein
VVLGRSERQCPRAIAEHEKRRFAADEQLLDDEARTGLAESPVDHHQLHLQLGVFQIVRNDHTFTGSQAVGFQHNGKSELAAP